MFQHVEQNNVEQNTEDGEKETVMSAAAMRILLAVDESENSHRVVQYVGSLLSRIPDRSEEHTSELQSH